MNRSISLLLSGIFLAAAGCSRTQMMDSLVAVQIQDRNGITETVTTPERVSQYEQIDFLALQPFKKVVRVFKPMGKGSTSYSKITTYYPNGSIWQYLEAQDFRAHGAYKEWFPNGQKKIEASVIGGTADVSPGAHNDWLFDGISYAWDEQGRQVAKIPYKQGELEGKSLYYSSSGNIEKELSFHTGQLEGEAIEYYPDGKIHSNTLYRNGVKSGPSVGYFANGQICWAEEYKEQLLLQGFYYDPQGKLISQVTDGFGFQAIFAKESLASLVQINQGCAEGESRSFTPSGDLKSIYRTKNGKKQGGETIFFLPFERGDANHEPLAKLSIEWDQNLIHGAVKSWYNTGQIQSQREFARNKRNGTSIAWYRDGSLMLLEEYEEDRLMQGQYYKRICKDPVSTICNGNGVATLFDEEGIFLQKVQYAKGEPLDPEN